MAQRAVGWCKTVHSMEYNSSSSFQSKGVCQVELDGLSRYREATLLDVA